MRAPAPKPPPAGSTKAWLDAIERAADRSRQLAVLDPDGRDLVESVGAALFNVRAALAGSHIAVAVDRLPDPADPELLAVIRPAPGTLPPALVRLDRAIPRRHTNRRPFDSETVPDDVLDALADVLATAEGRLVPVRTPQQRALLAEVTRKADRLAWLRAGEALERLLREPACAGCGDGRSTSGSASTTSRSAATT